MNKVRITVKKIARYEDLMEQYENPIEHACEMQIDQTFICNGWEKPEGFCNSAWDTISPFVFALAHGGENFYDGWMKNPKSAMISCNDGFRPVSFLIEKIDEVKMKYRIVDSLDNMDVNDVARLLKTTYWAKNRSTKQIEKSMRNSSCFGVYLEDEKKLIGFARVISDYTTMYYLCDVVIDTDYQHKGLGKALVSHIESLPEYAQLSGILATKDAHGLYRKFGYEILNDWMMVKSANRL